MDAAAAGEVTDRHRAVEAQVFDQLEAADKSFSHGFFLL
jgi:hypothetical protein